MSNLVKEVSVANFEVEVLKSDLPVVVDFWAPWCGPCKAAAPHLEVLAEKYSGRVKFVKVNVDEEAKLKVIYGVQGIPAFLFFKDGKIVERSIGFGAPSVGIWETILKKFL